MIRLPRRDDLSEAASGSRRLSEEKAPYLALPQKHSLDVVLDRLLEVLDLLLVEPGHLSLSELADILKILLRIQRLSLSLVPETRRKLPS